MHRVVFIVIPKPRLSEKRDDVSNVRPN